jgi:short-subunit dehydrogenase
MRAFVTGASRGLGRALVTELASRGIEVVATARRVDALDGLPAVLALPLDVTSDASVAAATDAAGPVDLLVNNAAVSIAAPVEATPAAEALAMFDTNVIGPLRMIAAILPGMRERGGGTVLNVSSVAGRAVFPLNGLHAASKHALEAMSEALALEAARFGIRVLVARLGSVGTGMFAQQARFSRPAYDPLMRAQEAGFAEHAAHQVPPERVAAAIVDAALSGESPLRVPIGQDAAWLLAERDRLDDAGWAARVSEMTKE